MTKEVDNTFKICVVGDSGIGKENFVESFVFSDIIKDASLRVGVDFYSEVITIKTEKGSSMCKIQVWNFSGEERFKFLTSKYCKGANGIMLFFDLADRESFLHLNDWLKEIEKGVGDLERIPILLIGNKSKLDSFAVSPKEIDQFIGKFNLVYIETSILTEEGISDSFYCITSLIIGIDINSKYFLSKDVIYRPNISRGTQIHEPSTLTHQDLRILSQMINEIYSSYEIEKESIPEERKDLIILAEVQWDDRIGPKLIKYFPNDIELDFSLSTVNEQLFDGSIAMYGQDHILNADGLWLNIKNVNLMAYIFFDSIRDESYRGDRKNYMFSLIAAKITYYQSLKIKQVFMNLSDIYKTQGKWDIKEFWIILSDILLKTSI